MLAGMKAKLLLFVAIVLVAAGAWPAAYYLAQLGWQVASMFQTRSWAMPDALLPALAGLAAIALGAAGIVRQKRRMRAEKQRRADRVRRLQDYRRDATGGDTIDGRREPFIGTRDRRVA
jgi:hypothetical protein